MASRFKLSEMALVIPVITAGGDLVLPAGDGPGQRGELENVVVPGAPVIEGEEPIAHLALAGRGAGDPHPQVQHVTQLSCAIQAAAIS